LTDRSRRWRVRLTDAAEIDIRQIVRWTEQRFGAAQSTAYGDTLAAALKSLAVGPGCPGARQRDDIRPGYFTLHVSRHGRRGRHFLLCRIVGDPAEHMLAVLRVLHDAMDLARHLPPESDDA